MHTEQLTEFEDSTPLLGDTAALRAKGEADGYLFFRGLLPAEAVTSVRRDALGVLDRAGWLAEGGAQPGKADGALDVAELSRAETDRMRVDIGVTEELYVRIQQLPSIHALPHHPALLDLYAQLIGDPVFVHPRHIVRSMTPHPAIHPTPAHQDFPHIQGTHRTWTCWFPLGDCPTTLGSLSVLRGSNALGYVPIDSSPGAGGIAAQLCRDEDDWLGADFAAGDVLTFPSYTVHRALKPSVRDRVRLSMDVRYQSAIEPIDASSLTNHSDHPWSEIYADWEDDALQYYWTADEPRLSPWDASLLQPGLRIC